jgi:hypothetical protein
VDEKEFKERASRLQEIGKVLEKIPVGVQAEAFNLLKGYVAQHADAPVGKHKAAREQDDSGDDADFFGKFDHDKPSDNVRLIAAHIFREYGSAPFSAEEVRSVATSVGITVPDRVDATLRQAAEKGHKLFASAGRGKFKPTVHGESHLKTTYQVRKGTKVRAEPDK